jgi:hypothetical protein
MPYPPEYDRQEVVPLRTPNIARGSSPSGDSGSDGGEGRSKRRSYVGVTSENLEVNEHGKSSIPTATNSGQKVMDFQRGRNPAPFIPYSAGLNGFRSDSPDIDRSSFSWDNSMRSSSSSNYVGSYGADGWRRSSFGSFGESRPSRRSSLQTMGIKTKKIPPPSPPAFVRPLSTTNLNLNPISSYSPASVKRRVSLGSRTVSTAPSVFESNVPLSTPLARSKKLDPLAIENHTADAAFLQLMSGASRSATPIVSRSVSLQKDASEDRPLPPRRPGILVTMISRISPGGPLPMSYVNVTALKLPVQIGTVASYCQKYGYA